LVRSAIGVTKHSQYGSEAKLLGLILVASVKYCATLRWGGAPAALAVSRAEVAGRQHIMR
jgi:hypothetical protein